MILKDKICLYKFKGYDISGIINHPLSLYKFTTPKKHTFRLILELIYVCLFDRYIYSFNLVENSKICCFSSIIKNRPDIKKTFQDVINTIPNKSIIYEEVNIRINCFTFFSKLFSTLVWAIQLHRHYTISERLIIIKTLIEVYTFKKKLDINEDKMRNYKLLLVMNDSLPSGNFIVQFFKNRTVKTATLQHGVVLAPRQGVDNVDFVGLELLNSNSDYFLAWNNFTKNEALKAGMPENKIKVLGIIRCIHLEGKIKKKENLNVFGVVLDGEFTEENNLKLIKIALELSNKLNMRFILRFHPQMDIHKYDHLLAETDRFGGYSSNNKDDIFKYMEQVAFSIVANSTAYIEMVFNGHITYRYQNNSSLCKYKEVALGGFTTLLELLQKVENKNLSIIEQEIIYKLLVSIDNIKESYSKFFSNFYNSVN